MNFDTACKILEVQGDININKIKKSYREKALLYHPDKNSSPESCKKFQEINEAYQYLMNNHNINCENSYEYNSSKNSYKNIFMEFLQNIMRENKNWNMNEEVDGDFSNKLFRSILYKITDLCQEKALEIIEKVEKNTLLKIYEILLKYSSLLHISQELLDKINQVLVNKIKNDQCIILNPTFKDIFNDQIYKLVIDGEIYLIPLWHKELVYDVSGCDLIVRCIPVLPPGVSIDDKNNIEIYIEYDLNEFIKNFWGKQEFEFHIDGIPFYVPLERIGFIENHDFKIHNTGISKINEKNIYDVRLRGDITLYLRLIHIQK